MSSRSEERLRQGFKRYLNPFMLALWRLGFGPWFRIWPALSGNVLVLRHVGRKSGIRRYQPLNFALVDDDIYCVAGFGTISDWYRNIQANPNVEVWLPTGWWEGVASDVDASARRTELVRRVLVGSGFATYLAGLNPRRMSDAEVEAATANYRLIRVCRGAARTGPGGPGALAWVWQLGTLIGFGWALRNRRAS